MSAINYSISIDLGAKLDIMQVVNRTVFPLLSQAVDVVADATANQWREAVLRAKLWSGEKDAYAGSITVRPMGDLERMVETDYKHAQAIETGRSARDLKRMLDTSDKVRRTTDGRRFLVIPMRHNTPGNNAHAQPMPPNVHAMVQNFTKSTVNQTGLREVGQTVRLSPHQGMTPARGTPFLSSLATREKAMTTARLYSWGDRLGRKEMREAGMDAATRRRYGGMVRMDTSTPGSQNSSGFLTFRIMMEGSKGWIVPAQPGLYLAKKTAEQMQPVAEAAFTEAVRRSTGG